MMTYGEIKQLVINLKAENDSTNNELIDFYERKLQEVYDNELNKALRKISRKKALFKP